MARNRGSERALMTTEAPSRARRRADAVPMPGSVEAPVTMATLPSNRRPNVRSSTALLGKLR